MVKKETNKSRKKGEVEKRLQKKGKGRKRMAETIQGDEKIDEQKVKKRDGERRKGEVLQNREESERETRIRNGEKQKEERAWSFEKGKGYKKDVREGKGVRRGRLCSTWGINICSWNIEQGLYSVQYGAIICLKQPERSIHC